MSLSYNVYKNDYSGGIVDFTTILANTASLTYLTAVLPHPCDVTYVVRAVDSVTGYEETNTDARVRLVLDAAGVDITNRPTPPTDLSAQPTSGGGARIEWFYLTVPGSTPPTSFKVWVQVGSLNYALTPSTTSVYESGRTTYLATVSGLTDGATYTIGVRATNASGDEANTTTTTMVADASGPLPVAELFGQPTY